MARRFQRGFAGSPVESVHNCSGRQGNYCSGNLLKSCYGGDVGEQTLLDKAGLCPQVGCCTAGLERGSMTSLPCPHSPALTLGKAWDAIRNRRGGGEGATGMLLLPRASLTRSALGYSRRPFQGRKPLPARHCSTSGV